SKIYNLAGGLPCSGVNHDLSLFISIYCGAIKITEKLTVELKITGLTHDARGVGRHQGLAVFVDGALPGELVKIRIKGIRKNHAEGVLERVLEASPHRIISACSGHGRCGGCQLLHLGYDRQLVEKKEMVENALGRIGGFQDIVINDTLGMDNPMAYRNKILFQVGAIPGRGDGRQLALGFFEKGSNRLVPGIDCLLISPSLRKLASELEDLINKYGCIDLKRVLIRQSHFNKEILVGLIYKESCHHKGKLSSLVEGLRAFSDKIVSIMELVIPNPRIPWKGESRILYGRDHIIEEVNGRKFLISAHSFFQVNTLQANVLYKKVMDYCGLDGSGTVFDLYCGTGTIGILLAKKAKMVYGIESLKGAVVDARENAKLNEVRNIEFIRGKSEAEVPKLLERGIRPNVIVVDPPRKGCNPELLDAILKVRPGRVVCVSCNPSTLARDLKLLANKYKIKEAQPVDLFPWTHHVEVIVKLEEL
ncbi:MAG: 23S rRNA (uracil(1939)-C(5))-methyltransferase RlmD, partial [Clostridia bacterium]|nr:23S rRNA (uracil(1939)-C(5))-methyltransferase RlmD [Clostridia bacterium]